jgi:phenylpropionate dioxygenase-like ring-hydroxylating dioxygenase large terminal subunit
MGAIDHWHPVCQSRKLGRQPQKVRVDGRNIVLFRTESGEIGALSDCCVHRRMSLAKGTVVSGRLQCAYHGWNYDASGVGESPGTPKLQSQTLSYDTAEQHGLIWIKPRDCEAVVPHFDVAGYYHLCTLGHVVRAPLEVVLDNFCEIEHTPTTHALFGYDLARMAEVTCEVETTDTSVRVINRGPQKRMPWLVRQLIRVGPRGEFIDDWATHFSPVYSIYDHSWIDPDTGEAGMVRWRIVIFFTPQDDETTAVTTLAFTKSSYPGRYGGVRLARPILSRLVEREVQLDIAMLENLADKNPSLEGMKLSRFDRALGLNRERIERVYRGKS